MFVVGFRRDRVSIGCLGRNSGGGPCAQSCSFQRSYGLPRGWSGVQNNTRGNILCGQRLEYTGYCEGCTYKLRQQQRAEQKSSKYNHAFAKSLHWPVLVKKEELLQQHEMHPQFQSLNKLFKKSRACTPLIQSHLYQRRLRTLQRHYRHPMLKLLYL